MSKSKSIQDYIQDNSKSTAMAFTNILYRYKNPNSALFELVSYIKSNTDCSTKYALTLAKTAIIINLINRD